jgi:hypothetical protein
MARLKIEHDPDCTNVDIIERAGSLSCIGCSQAVARRGHQFYDEPGDPDIEPEPRVFNSLLATERAEFYRRAVLTLAATIDGIDDVCPWCGRVPRHKAECPVTRARAEEGK